MPRSVKEIGYDGSLDRSHKKGAIEAGLVKIIKCVSTFCERRGSVESGVFVAECSVRLDVVTKSICFHQKPPITEEYPFFGMPYQLRKRFRLCAKILDILESPNLRADNHLFGKTANSQLHLG